MRRLLLTISSLSLGVIATLVVAWWALASADQASSMSTTIMIRGGTEAWLVRRLDSFGLIWVNGERLRPALVNPAPDFNDLPAWATPSSDAWPIDASPRVATLAVGWPAPFVTRQWSTISLSQIFPLQVDLDDGRDSLRRAAGRFMERDDAPPRRILWRGLIINVGLFSLAAAAVGWILHLLLRTLLHRQERDDPAHE